MKGAFFQSPFQYTLEVTGDDFRQGASVPCKLTIKNQAQVTQPLAGLKLELALGDTKKVKAKNPEAFESVALAKEPLPSNLDPQQQHQVLWNFQLDQNCSISDKSQSLYLVYGGAGQPPRTEFLPLTVKPNCHVESIIGIFESFFQFVFKEVASDGDYVTAKFKPSSAPKFSLVEELNVGFSFRGDTLLMRYKFRVKKFDSTQTNLSVKKAKSMLEQEIAADTYLTSGGYLNNSALEQKIGEALSTVASEI